MESNRVLTRRGSIVPLMGGAGVVIVPWEAHSNPWVIARFIWSGWRILAGRVGARQVATSVVRSVAKKSLNSSLKRIRVGTVQYKTAKTSRDAIKVYETVSSVVALASDVAYVWEGITDEGEMRIPFVRAEREGEDPGSVEHYFTIDDTIAAIMALGSRNLKKQREISIQKGLAVVSDERQYIKDHIFPLRVEKAVPFFNGTGAECVYRTQHGVVSIAHASRRSENEIEGNFVMRIAGKGFEFTRKREFRVDSKGIREL